ncbi:MAG: alpha/beta hydrolase [Alphaproteobacteria bacterium]|jgi:3-oxoadipate enol-lactonase|nr:alpha/beta fold hydrolase [Rhodospirillaceae bacterium]MBT6512408.1 alpha/beta fold hydrolase [Rhodospirillaceae bacterium]MBT7646788.1 alpha/beta fold hydrolase [Rhodospirillaceae bacterium]MDG2479280.1 alpha/beta hydrolase [Alphaproteobacteria bacterium]
MAAIEVDYTVTGSGPPIFMVHGIGGRRSGWNDIIAFLKDDFTCITYDQRGHGTSPVPPVPYSLDELVEDLEALRAKLGIEKAHVIGHSLGGMIAPAYARTYPERVMTLGLLSTAAARTHEDAAKVKGVITAMEEKGIPNILDTLVDRWFTDDFLANNPDLVQARLKEVLDTPAEVFLAVFRVYAATEMAPWLHQITAPSLVLTGEFDGGCNPRLNAIIDSLLPTSELVVLPDLRHSILKEAAEDVASHVKRFIAAHG